MRRDRNHTAILAALAAALVCLSSSAAHAQQPAASKQPQIGITVDRDTLVQGEAFQLTISIATESEQDPLVKLPPLGGLRVLRQSESHPMSFSFSFGFGKQAQRISQRQSVYDFVVVADRPGRFIIDPVVVEVDGRKYQSKPYSLDVGPSAGGAPTVSPTDPTGPTDPGAAPSGPSPEAPPIQIDAGEIDPDYFISMSLSKERVVAGELTVLTVHLYTTWNLSGYHLVREPGTEGFWAETMETNGQRPRQETVQLAGRTYERTEIRKLALFPVKTGKLTIAPAVVELEVRRGGFFAKRKTVKRVSAPIELEVLDAPASGRPDGFDPANVGRFSFRANVDRTEVKVGEPVTLTMIVRGAGNLRNLALPTVENVDGFKVYAPESDTELHALDGGVTGSRTSKILMIPKAPGKFEIPPIEWVHFDPDADAYRTLSSDRVEITVTPGDATSATSGPTAGGDPLEATGEMDRLNRKLRSITSRTDMEIGASDPLLTRPWFLGLVALAPFAYLALLIVTAARRRIAAGEAKGRSKKADAIALRQIAQLAGEPASTPSDRFFAGLHKIIVAFLEARLEAPVAGDTMSELMRRLVDRGVDEELASRTVMELEACDFARFAAGTSSREERGKATERAAALIRDLGGVCISPIEEEPR